jgi:hypothetical protein
VPTYYLVNGVGMRIMQCQDWLWGKGVAKAHGLVPSAGVKIGSS